MSDIIAMHKADLVNAVTEAVQPLKARIDTLEAQDEVHWKTRRTLLAERDALADELATSQGHLAAHQRMAAAGVYSTNAEFRADVAEREALKVRAKALEADRDQISLTLAVAGADRDKWFNRARDLEKALREIAGGLMPVDSAADHHNRYELCAGRLCKIARDALLATSETTVKPERKWSGVGHLEETGYIPVGSAAERETKDE